MAVYSIQAPDGRIFDIEGPDDATEDQVLGFAQQQFSAQQQPQQQQQPTKYDPTTGGNLNVAGFDTGIGLPDWASRGLAGVGRGMASLGRGVGQAIGAVSQEEVDEAARTDAALLNTTAGKVGNVAGMVAAAAPTAFIPGANTLAGAAAIGAGTGALTTEGTPQERALGAVGGAAGGALGVGVGKIAGNMLNRSAAKAAAKAAERGVVDDTIIAAQKAGYKLPPSETGAGFFTNAAESFGGKAAIGQAASRSNQEVTNGLARQAIGLKGKGQISGQDILNAKKPHLAVYKEAEQISPDAKDAVEFWRTANDEAKAHWKDYGKNLTVAAQKAAKRFDAEAKQWLSELEEEARKVGNNSLVARLRAARVELGKIGSVERALNDDTGDVIAGELAKMKDRGVPLSGGLQQIASFANAFPKYTQPSKQTGMAGVSAMNFPTAAVLGTGVHPAAAILPFLRGGARNALLSTRRGPPTNVGAARNALARYADSPVSGQVGMNVGIEQAR